MEEIRLTDNYWDLKEEIKDLDEVIDSVEEEIRKTRKLEELEGLISERDDLLYQMLGAQSDMIELLEEYVQNFLRIFSKNA